MEDATPSTPVSQGDPNSANFIETMTNADIAAGMGLSTPQYAFSNDHYINDAQSINKMRNVATTVSDASQRYQTGIGAYRITNEEGVKYLYELPVYSADEYRVRYNILPSDGATVDNDYKVYFSAGFNGEPRVGGHLSESRP
jgi:hypothetical protein